MVRVLGEQHSCKRSPASPAGASIEAGPSPTLARCCTSTLCKAGWKAEVRASPSLSRIRSQLLSRSLLILVLPRWCSEGQLAALLHRQHSIQGLQRCREGYGACLSPTQPHPPDIQISCNRSAAAVGAEQLFTAMRQVYTVIQAAPLLMGSILGGQLPTELLERLAASGVHLLPRAWSEVHASCTCPDFTGPGGPWGAAMLQEGAPVHALHPPCHAADFMRAI